VPWEQEPPRRPLSHEIDFPPPIREELEARFPDEWRAWRTSAVTPPGGEPTDLVIARMRRALERILAQDGPTLVRRDGEELLRHRRSARLSEA